MSDTGWIARILIVALVVPLAVTIAAAQDAEGCLECHGKRETVVMALGELNKKASEERIAALVVKEDGKESVHHGVAGCTTCHPDAEEYPHPEDMAMEETCTSCHEDSLDDVNESAHADPEGGEEFKAKCWDCHGGHGIRRKTDPLSRVHPSRVVKTCLQCHDKREYLRGVHGRGLLRSGLDVSASCVSCHGAHGILPHRDQGSRIARRNISATCGKCHGRVMDVYAKSVHGAALAENDNPDVPTCVDCHEAHGTIDPFRPGFRAGTPKMCGRCHDDEKTMAKYGLSTEVFSTYVADFHGTTAQLFEAATPDEPLNQAVCYDCHGFHDVESVRKMGPEKVQERMLVRCQACHEDATVNFMDAWLGHYIPSPDRYPLIYYINLFYELVIPGTIGFFLLYIGIDAFGRVRRKVRRHG
jgi:predicted CXXCH cytochrome family protein